MSVIIDLNKVCLICLQHEGRLHNIFSPDEQNPEVQIFEKIGLCSELKLDMDNDKIPNKICENCLNDLRIAWRFRQNCETALSIYQTILQDQDDYEVTIPQKVKVPQGLKIKRLRPQINSTSNIPTELEEMENEAKNFLKIDHLCQIKAEQLDYDEDLQRAETVQIDGEDEETMRSTEDEEEFVECYMTEEILDDYEDDASQQDHIVTLSPKQQKAEEFAEETEESNCVPEPIRVVSHRRNRGRSKKIIYETTLNLRNDLKHAEGKNREKNENIKQTVKGRKVRTRKRKSISPDSKPPKICEICGNSYRYQHALNAHMRRHNNDKPYPCEFCDKAFVSNVELRRHIRVHTGQKPYGCQYCDRRFSDFGSRIKHERTHTGERPYVCGTCGKSFAYAHVLSVHIRTHTGEKKFRCEQCGKGFTKKAYLLTHLEQHSIINRRERNETKLMDNKLSGLEEIILTTEYIEEDDDECDNHGIVDGFKEEN